MKVQHYLFLFWVVLAGLLNACKSKSEGDLTDGKTSQLGDLVLAESKDVMVQTIGTQGGVLEVKDPQSPLNGFKISVPAGAYSSAVSFSISATEVVKHGFGNEYKVLSPLISISGAADGYTKDFIIIDIPIVLPENHFAAAVLMDDKGLLDILPLISLSKNQLKVGISSFSKTGSVKNGRIAGGKEDFTFLVTSIDKSGLLNFDGPNTATFTPGVDDWAFANRGSILASGGHCSGSTMSALWYFNYRKKATNIPLHQLGAASNAPDGLKPEKVEKSNSLGIKFVSLIQEIAAGFNERVVNYVKYVYQNTSKIERDNCLFYYASFYLRTMKEPLLLGLKSSTDLARGHMIMIIGKKKERLMLANPNAPGQTQILTFNTSAGLESFASAEMVDEVFDYDVLYALPPHLFDRDIAIQAIWEEAFESRLAENTSYFPKFSYFIKNVNGTITRTTLQSGTVNKIRSPFVVGISSSTNVPKTKVSLFKANGDPLNLTTDYYVLPLGVHKIGMLVEKDTLKKGEVRQLWADFQWFDVEVSLGDDYPNCQITTPEGLSVDKPGEVGKQYTFSLGSNCSLPAKTLFFWDFGDGTTSEAVDNPIARHTFTKSGDFTVKLRLLPDGTADYIIRETKVRIGQPDNKSPEYFTYKMNGVAFSDSDPGSEYINSPPDQGLFLDYVNGVGKAYKVLTGDGWDTIYYRIYLGVMPSQWKGVGSYELTKFEKGKIANATAVVGGPGQNVISDSGTLTITRKDDLWIEGTFNFKAGSYNVTEGKFRIKF